MRILVEIGTRPEIINTASLVRCIQDSNDALIYLHTGQHYDFKLSKQFIEELQLPTPHYEFSFREKSQARQTGRILMLVEEALIEAKPDVVVVQGDTNSSLATALAAVKLQIPVAHIEAGNRSFDMRRAEEVNRIIIDHISQVLFTQSRTTKDNLLKEGVEADRIHVVGHPVVDACLQHLELAERKTTLQDLEVTEPFIVVTAHRAENVDRKDRLVLLLKLLQHVRKEGYTIVFPAHPRTKRKMEEFELLSDFMATTRLCSPLGYLDFLNLLKKCELVVTDSGGIQKEVATLRKPCIYFHTSTGAWEGLGTFLFLGGYEFPELQVLTKKLLYDPEIRRVIQQADNPYGDGKTGEKILSILQQLWKEKKLTFQTFHSTSMFEGHIKSQKRSDDE